MNDSDILSHSDENILSHLNPDQQQAVSFKTGPLLILAGAGSGKTRVLTYRAAWLIKNRQVLPQNILLLTFTNKAAEEMKARLHQLLVKSSKSSVNLPWAGTFHAFCARILRHEGRYLEIPLNYLIYDEADQKQTLKLAIDRLGLSPKRFSSPAVAAVISQAKNELITPLEYLNYVQGEWQQAVAQIYLKYQQLLKEFGALDFDDLLMATVRLFQKDKSVAQKYQDQYPWILIDEYQDTNHAQYTLTHLLAGSRRNLTAVGDASQCLPAGTLISTPNGPIPIQKIIPNTEILAASGRGKIGEFSVTDVSSRKYKGDLIEITTNSKKRILATPNHFLFARLVPVDNLYFVYLMYRRDKGYRIGVAKGKRAGDLKRGYLPTMGLCTRGNQEAADKMWILKACRKKEVADFWEYWFSSQYGIPTLVFDTGGRRMRLSQFQINKLFSTINTAGRAQQLMEDFQIDPEFPHHRPRGTSGNKHPDRQIIHLKFFEDRRQSARNPWSAHRIALNTTDINLEKKVKMAGFFTRAGRRNTWRTEILRLRYNEAEKIAKALSEAGRGLEISREAFLGDNQKFFFQPASHIQPGMIIPVRKNNKIQSERVISVKRKAYWGIVYDLNIPQVHNYLANEIAIHNSIYSWRGADFRNLTNLQKDFPDLKIINLEQNYRSTQIILDAANEVIKKNTAHPILKLWTAKKGGEKITLYQAESEAEEAIMVLDIIYRHQSTRSWSDFAVLYRTNAQSRILEEAFLKMGVPYALVGGVHFYERKEIKDCLAYLRLTANSKDAVSLKRAEKMGKIRLKKFQEFITKKGFPLKEMPTLEILDGILKATGYLETFDENDPQDQSRIENVQELCSVATQFPHLLQFLENVALIQQEYLPSDTTYPQTDSGRVTLMTCHAAKGTEFPQVIIVGLEEGLFPHSRSIAEKDLLEEERRLCYVAMTRAKEKLYLVFARQRFFLGERSANPPSRFIDEIPAHLLDFRNGKIGL